MGDLDLLVLLDDGVILGAPGGHALDDLLRCLGSEAPVVSLLAIVFRESLSRRGSEDDPAKRMNRFRRVKGADRGRGLVQSLT